MPPSRPNCSRSVASVSGCFTASTAGSADSTSQVAPPASVARTTSGFPTAAVTARSSGCRRLSSPPVNVLRSRAVSSGSSVFQTVCPGARRPRSKASRANVSSTRPAATGSVSDLPPANTSYTRPPAASSLVAPHSKATPSPRFTPATSSTATRPRCTLTTVPSRTPRFALEVAGTSILWSQPPSQPGEKPRENESSISSTSRGENSAGRAATAASIARR